MLVFINAPKLLPLKINESSVKKLFNKIFEDLKYKRQIQKEKKKSQLKGDNPHYITGQVEDSPLTRKWKACTKRGKSCFILFTFTCFMFISHSYGQLFFGQSENKGLKIKSGFFSLILIIVILWIKIGSIYDSTFKD